MDLDYFAVWVSASQYHGEDKSEEDAKIDEEESSFPRIDL